MSNKSTECGHKNYYAKGLCPRCYARQYWRERYRTDPQYREKKLQWTRNTPNYIEGGKTRTRKSLLKKYGISEETYNVLFQNQKGVCAICGKPSNNRRLAIDHDHQTKKIRGLLCMPCNTTIGMYKNEPEVFNRMIIYLNKEHGDVT